MSPLSCLALALASALAHQASAAPPEADPFLDGTQRSAPALVPLAGGSFTMGSDASAPGFTPGQSGHEATVSPFAIGVHEVTNAQFCEFLNDLGNQVDHGIRWLVTDEPDVALIREVDGVHEPLDGAADRPVVAVTWRAALAYCQWLSAKTGRRYRLPTEAEWEFAARAGTTTTWPWGDEWDPSLLHASPGGDLLEESAPVGSYPPNAWGLHDMLGNVWEFVADCHSETYRQNAPEQDPVIWDPACWTPGIRGGSFVDGASYCRPGYRQSTWWWGPYEGVGFRVVREESPSRWYRPRPMRLGEGPVAPDEAP